MKKSKHDKKYLSFVALERRVLFRCPEWRSLTLRAKVIYLYLKAHYQPLNHGQIQLHFSQLQDIPGFASKRGFYSGIRELEVSGWIVRVNGGGLYRNPNLYRLTGKFDEML